MFTKEEIEYLRKIVGFFIENNKKFDVQTVYSIMKKLMKAEEEYKNGRA